MIYRADLIAEARTWLGTPFVHQQSRKGIASDCIGFVGGVAVALRVPCALEWSHDERFKNYARTPDPDLLLRACDEYMDQVPRHTTRPGDVLVMKFQKEPMHFGYLSAPGYMIHCYEPRGGVVEHGIDPKWSQRILRTYRLRGLD